MIGFDKTNSVAQIVSSLRSAYAVTEEAHPTPQWLFDRLGLLWDSFADKAAIWPRLQYYYTLRAALDALLAGEWPSIDWAEDADQKDSQRFAQLHTLRADADTEINALLTASRASRAPQTGIPVTTNPGAPAYPGAPNPNDPRFAGSILPACRWRGW